MIESFIMAVVSTFTTLHYHGPTSAVPETSAVPVESTVPVESMVLKIAR